MDSKTNPLATALHVLREVQHNHAYHHRRVSGAELDAQLKILRAWQAQRIARTYADFARDPRHTRAVQFFLTDLYAPRDFSQRDHDLERGYQILSRLVPQSLLTMLIQSITLNHLTQQLDHTLLDVLVNQLALRDRLTGEMYAEAYRRCNNYSARVKQIELIVHILRQADDAVRFPMTGTALKLAQAPAAKAGWREMYDFLARGYAAFKQMRGAEDFIETIETRERALLERIYAGKNPFD